MREIKFRAQNFGGNWIYSDNIGLKEFFEMLKPDGSTAIINSNTVGEFTGEKDKTGKEIYEGDILHCYLEDGGAYQDIGNHVVKYDQCAFRAMYCLAEMSPIIILGNIYQNPELVKQYERKTR